MKMKWILASASPRRRQLLGELIDEFEVIPSLADEDLQEASPRALVEKLAEKKASEVALRPECEGAIVVGSDTVVAIGNEVLGKPVDETDAFRMLTALSGREHAVYTGVCFARAVDGKLALYTRSDRTAVHFNELSPKWIEDYIRGGSPMDKAGAYGIQDGGLVERIEGSYTNVVGFPTELVREMIEKIGREWND